MGFVDGEELITRTFTNPCHTLSGTSVNSGAAEEVDNRREKPWRGIPSLREEVEMGAGLWIGEVDCIIFIQMNHNHYVEAYMVVVLKLTSSNINFSLIQEPCIRSTDMKGLKAAGYQLYREELGLKPRTTILVTGVLSWAIPDYLGGDVVAALLRFRGQSLMRFVSATLVCGRDIVMMEGVTWVVSSSPLSRAQARKA